MNLTPPIDPIRYAFSVAHRWWPHLLGVVPDDAQQAVQLAVIESDGTMGGIQRAVGREMRRLRHELGHERVDPVAAYTLRAGYVPAKADPNQRPSKVALRTGYRTDSARHSTARMTLTPETRRDIARKGAEMQDPDKRLTYMRATYGDTPTMDAIETASGDIQAAYKALRAQRQRDMRAREKAERAARRTDEVLFCGPVEISPNLQTVIDGGKPVVTDRGAHCLRATFHDRVLSGLPAEMYDADLGDPGNHIVLYDHRADEHRACAEIVWTGADYRIHIYRRSALDARTPIMLDITGGPEVV